MGIACPNKTKPRRQQTAMVDGNISRGGYNLPAIQFTRDGGNQFELTTNCPRTKELEDFSTLYSSSSFERDDVLSELESSLQEANIQNENIIQQLLSQLTKLETQLQSQSKSIKAKIDGLKEKHYLEKVLNQFSSHNEAIKDPPARSHDSNNRHDQLRRQNYEILEKITRSTYDNGLNVISMRRRDLNTKTLMSLLKNWRKKMKKTLT